MEEEKITLTDDDFREALREFGSYVDITEEDLKKLYEIAVKIAKERCAHSWLAREIMSQKVIKVKQDTDAYEAGRLLIKNNISGMPVVDDEDYVVGMISNADLLSLAGIPRGHIFNDTVMKYILNTPSPRHRTGKKVEDIMITSVITVTADTTAKKIAAILDKKRIKRVPVIDSENKIIGIVSRGDIIRVICENEEKEAKAHV